MEWVKQLALVAFGAVLGGIISYLAVKQERKTQDKARLISAIDSILVEVKSNLELAQEPWTGGRMVPFATQAWDVHKGHILMIPRQAQVELHQLYTKVQKANALFQLDVALGYGKGYYNNEYTTQCSRIASEAEKAKESLVEWLKQHGTAVEEGNEAAR